VLEVIEITKATRAADYFHEPSHRFRATADGKGPLTMNLDVKEHLLPALSSAEAGNAVSRFSGFKARIFY